MIAMLAPGLRDRFEFDIGGIAIFHFLEIFLYRAHFVDIQAKKPFHAEFEKLRIVETGDRNFEILEYVWQLFGEGVLARLHAMLNNLVIYITTGEYFERVGIDLADKKHFQAGFETVDIADSKLSQRFPGASSSRRLR